MFRRGRIAAVAALVAVAAGPGLTVEAGSSGWCTFDDETGIVRIGGAAQMAVGVNKDGVLLWGEAPAWNPNWFEFRVCNGGGKFVALDKIERIDIMAVAGSTTRGDDNWVFIFDEVMGHDAPEYGSPASGLVDERIYVMGPGSLMLSATLGPGQPTVTVGPHGVDRNGDGTLDLTFLTKPAILDLRLGDVAGGVTFDGSTYDLPGLWVFGSEDDDHITGSGHADRLIGEGGNDVVVGGGGDDEIWGVMGIDQLYGNGGDDEILGINDDDPDLMIGGSGYDTCTLSADDTPATVSCDQIT